MQSLVTSARTYCRSILLLFSLFMLSHAHAHTLGESYLFLDIHEHGIQGRVEITLTDLNRALGLDESRDGKVSQMELEANLDAVKSYVSDRIKLGANGAVYPIPEMTHDVMKAWMGEYLQLSFLIDGLPEIPEILDVDYNLLFHVDPKHRGLLIVESNERAQFVNKDETVALIFRPEEQRQQLDLTAKSYSVGLAEFVREGIWHIWIGIDHILFLLALVLPAVLKREDGRWQPVADFRSAFISVIKIVSLFTVAHSITLSLAGLGVVELPSRLVESIIALSVILASANNIFPVFSRHSWVIIFGFGLFHGFGFATVLGHLGLQKGSLLVPLLGFNLGVELGQIALIAVAFPVLYLLRQQREFYPNVVLRVGSAAIMLVAALWLIERAFGIGPIIGIV